MILSHLSDSARYESLHPLFKQVFDYIKTHDLLNAPAERVVLDGDKPSAEFLKKKIDSVTSQNETKYGKHDIMYSYEIEGDTHEKDSYSR